MRFWFVALIFLTALCPISSAEMVYHAAPSELPGVSRAMKTAGYWISQHPYPDKLIMSPLVIQQFNTATAKSGIINDLAAITLPYSGEKLKKDIQKIIFGMQGETLYQENGAVADDAFYGPLTDSMGLGDISSSVDVKFGFIVEPADARLLPTSAPLYAVPGDIDFDEVQNSGFELGTVIVVLHSSRDGRWLFVKDSLVDGWVEAAKVALTSRDEALSYLKRKDAVIVTSPKADLFEDRAMTQFAASVKMGSRFDLKGTAGRTVEVLVPVGVRNGPQKFRPMFFAREDVNIGYLPFTPRTILRQAFKMLNQPYGWGDMYGEQDCSRFLQMVFATVGIQLPRNSGEQARVGRSLADFDGQALEAAKVELLSAQGVGALTLLRLKGHIMLYLGVVNGRPYAIHATWAYREKVSGEDDRVRVLNQVVVSDLSLGESASKGSLAKRLITLRAIGY